MKSIKRQLPRRDCLFGYVVLAGLSLSFSAGELDSSRSALGWALMSVGTFMVGLGQFQLAQARPLPTVTLFSEGSSKCRSLVNCGQDKRDGEVGIIGCLDTAIMQHNMSLNNTPQGIVA